MRFTEKNRFNEYATINAESDFRAMVQKLGQLEDIMEKYGINSAEELEHIILNDATGEQAFREYFETNVMPYRNIEIELGISLVTLINVLKNGIYDKQGKYYYPHLEYLDDEYRKEWILVEEQGDYRPDFWFHFKDYGKTWALTKEELK